MKSKLPALLEITEALLSYGMTQDEIDCLLARFLEEEAIDFVMGIKDYLEKENTVLN